MSADLERRRSLLVAALAALRVKTRELELEAVHRWLDNWTGLGLIATGMEHQGYRLHLTNIEPGTWRATFSSHPMLSAEGFGAAPGSRVGRDQGCRLSPCGLTFISGWSGRAPDRRAQSIAHDLGVAG